MSELLFQFKDAIRAVGLRSPDVIEPGEWHRFPGVGKPKGNTAGYCKLFEDIPGGCFGDWSSDFSETWQPERDKPYTKAERAAFARQVKAAREQAEAERNARWAEAEKRAATIWAKTIPVPGNHPYLIRKRIQPHGARIHKNSFHKEALMEKPFSLTLPVMDFTDRLTSLQFITAGGGKQLLSGGRKQGCFIPVAGDVENPTRVIICEGWATGCTLAEDEPGAPVLAAIDAGNLALVALSARHRWPTAELVIAGDDDRLTEGNPGATKAKAAAIASGAFLALPQWPEDAPDDLTDFNDLVVWLAGGGA